MKNSSGQNWKVDESETGVRLDKWLAAPGRLGSRSRAMRAIDSGKVFVDEIEQVAADAGRRLQPGQMIRLWMDRPGSAERRYSERHTSGLHILYEDQSLLAINKPAGLLTVPLPAKPDEASLLELVRKHLRSQAGRQPLIVHRIDRDTSGIVVFAKSGPAQHNLKSQLEQHRVERTYLAVAHGHPSPESGRWRDRFYWDPDKLRQIPVDNLPALKKAAAKDAILDYRTIESFEGASLLEIRLITGKRNQIRAQAALHGCPLVGEKLYIEGDTKRSGIKLGRQALHAFRLSFSHPADGRKMRLEAPPPEDIEDLLARLRRS